MLHFKSCPKCSTGTVEHDFDTHGDFLQCINCGFMRDVADDMSKKDVVRLLTSWRKELQEQERESAETAA